MFGTTALRIRPVPSENVSFQGGFWEPRLDRNRRQTLEAQYQQNIRSGAIDALRVWDSKGQSRPKHPYKTNRIGPWYAFVDSDIAKWIEAASLSHLTHANQKNMSRVKDLVLRFESFQRRDGYMNSWYQTLRPTKRWMNLRDRHELYCAGHLIEAAIAHHRATGDPTLVETLRRYVGHIAKTFGRKRGQKRGYGGHPEIELALVKLYRATGDKSYLDLAKYFVDERGRKPLYFEIEAKQRGRTRPNFGHPDARYHQAHLPVRRQKTAEGHSVRALYLFAGMADVAAETKDQSLVRACKTLWKNVVEKRMYVTGGVGSTNRGERFTFDYDLPSESAYAETCASIALVFFSHRLFHLDPDGKYMDVVERALYNGILSGVSLDGRKFFYHNPLSQHPNANSFQGYFPPERQGWFTCPCCPSNLSRILADLGSYTYSQGPREIHVHLYASGRADLSTSGTQVRIKQKTGYPWKEKVFFRIDPKTPTAFTLSLRIPGWCRGIQVRVNGQKQNLVKIRRKGYARLKRTWKAGDRVELTLPMPVEVLEADPGVRTLSGQAALMRGPVVYCLEETDNGKKLASLVLPRRMSLRARLDPKLLGGITVLTGRALRRKGFPANSSLYRSRRKDFKSVTIKAIPYYAWANRGVGEMRVWIPGQF